MREMPDIDALAATLGIPLLADWREAIQANLALSLAMGAEVAAFPLDDEAGPAPVFSA